MGHMPSFPSPMFSQRISRFLSLYGSTMKYSPNTGPKHSAIVWELKSAKLSQKESIPFSPGYLEYLVQFQKGGQQRQSRGG